MQIDYETNLIFPEFRNYLIKLEKEEKEYADRTRNILLELEYVLNHLKDCRRCGDRFFNENLHQIYCLECRDAREIYASAQRRKASIYKYYNATLGHMPEEKQEVIDFLDSIINEWKASLM